MYITYNMYIYLCGIYIYIYIRAKLTYIYIYIYIYIYELNFIHYRGQWDHLNVTNPDVKYA